jgi:AraC-like DNA-binding protein
MAAVPRTPPVVMSTVLVRTPRGGMRCFVAASTAEAIQPASARKKAMEFLLLTLSASRVLTGERARGKAPFGPAAGKRSPDSAAWNCAAHVGIAMMVSKVMRASLLVVVAVAGAASAGEIHELLGPGRTRDISRAQELLRSDPKLASARDTYLRETPLHIVARFDPIEMVDLLIRTTVDVNATAYNNESLNKPSDETTIEPVEISEGRCRVGRAEGPEDLVMPIGHCRFGSPDAARLVALPPQVVLACGEPRFTTPMRLVGGETRTRRPARVLILQRLLEVLPIEMLRCGGDTASALGLARGLVDDRLASALRAIHSRPEHPWTAVELAGEAALSRSAFFVRFSRTVGLPPMEYLLAWRRALARRSLRGHELGMAEVAIHVGYNSASTFSVAFACQGGVPPAQDGRMSLHGNTLMNTSVTSGPRRA